MSALIQNLERLNRKERFFLVRTALGDGTFRMGRSFRDRMECAFSMDIPADAFVSMDYHLNWIFAALALSFEDPVHDRVYDNGSGEVDGTQEDVDLLVAFEDSYGFSHLIMLEAKGVGAYDNEQFEHKMDRFRCIFGQDGCRFATVRPHFGLISPREPRRLKSELCPPWLKVNGKIPWLPMPIPERLTLFGCDHDGKADKKRQFWTVRPEHAKASPEDR